MHQTSPRSLPTRWRCNILCAVSILAAAASPSGQAEPFHNFAGLTLTPPPRFGVDAAPHRATIILTRAETRCVVDDIFLPTTVLPLDPTPKELLAFAHERFDNRVKLGAPAHCRAF